MPHPSLQEPINLPAHLIPKRTMPRNADCWCNSGKKWKKCHKDRHIRKPVDVGMEFAKLKDEFTKGYCSHPNASTANCSGAPIRSHTVQRRGGIEAIAEKGHVISAKTAGQDIYKNKGKFIPRSVGVRSASTFPGFCNLHDTQMFRPIEKSTIQINDETCFLLSFRAISYEHFQKNAALRASESLRESDFGKPFEEQIYIQENLSAYRAGLIGGLQDTTSSKNGHDEVFREKLFEEHHYFAIECVQLLPIVGCGGFLPEFDFQGNEIQKIGYGTHLFQHISLNISVLNGKSIIVFGWTDNIDGPAADFVSSFAKLPKEDLIEAAVRTAFEHIENIYFRPSWWSGLSKEEKNALTYRMRTGLGMAAPGRIASCLLPDQRHFTSNIDILDVYQSRKI